MGNFFKKAGKFALNAYGGGLGSSIFGGGGDPGKKQLAQVLAMYKQLQMQQRGDFANAYQQQRGALRTLETGYEQARGEIARVGESSRAQAVERGQQQSAAGTQSLASRGLGNTTAAQNLERAIQGDTSRSLAAIDEAIAGMQSGLLTQKANAVAQGQSALSGLLMQQSGARTALGGDIAQTIASVQHTDPNAWISNLLTAGIGAAGLFSDRRLKRSIRRVGEKNGIGIYEFEYRGRVGRYRGVMADEVAHIAGAVSHDDRGYARVHYPVAGIAFERVA